MNKLNYTTVKNLQFVNSDNTDAIACDVFFEHLGMEVPFIATPFDCMEHGVEIHRRAMQGDFGPINAYEPPAPPTTEELAAQIRAERDRLLAQTDWTQAADVPQATKDKWAPYRQALRDVPQQAGFPTDVTWPTKPE